MIARQATAADLPAVAALFDLYRQFYGQAPDPGTASEFVGSRFRSNESTVLVADAGESGLVGFCQLYPTFCSVQAQPIYTLYDLFVHPDARRLGVGRCLLLAARARAEADGMFRMDLSTARSNVAAQALYASLGWVRDEAFYTYSLKTTR
jgi:ribosomal protein S18 acetylase RimI-like enzyme